MGFPKSPKEKLLYLLINRSALFLFVMCLLTISLYLIGTNQGFVDTTQLGLLRFYAVLAMFLTTISVCGVVINIIRFKDQKRLRYFFRSACYLLLMFFSLGTVLTVMFIFTLSTGSAV